MEPTRYQHYMHTVNAFIKANSIAHEGVLHNVIEGFPAIFEQLTSCHALTREETEVLLQAYAREDAVFLVRFAHIFERCIGDPVLRSDVELTLGGLYTWAKVITTVSQETFDRLLSETEGMSYALSCKVFDTMIRTEHEALSDLVDRCYEALYK